MTIHRAFWRFATTIFFLSAPVIAQVKVASVEGITEYRLENGLRVLLFPDPSKPTITVNVTFLVGSKHEKYGETGMAHLLEHLVFKGTAKRPDVWKEIDAHGCYSNGSTWYERTNYFETCPATDDNLRWALDMEADRMVNSRIAQKDLNSEMTVVRNEYESGETYPSRVLHERVMQTAYTWHAFGKDTIGARSDIENVPIDHLQAFYRKYYQPDNALLLVAGKFDETKALAWSNEFFGRLPRPERKLERSYTTEPVQDGERTTTVRRVGDLQMIMAAYHVPAGTHPDFPALEVLTTLLGDSPSGRIYKALVDNKKAANVWYDAMALSEPGMVTMTARVLKENSIDAARKLMIDTIESTAKEPPTAEEVERARTKLLKYMDLSLNDSRRVGIEISEWAAMGDWRMLFLERDRIRKVTPEDVKRVAATYLKESNRTVGLFLPTDKPDRAEIPASPDVETLVKDYRGQTGTVAGEFFDRSPANIEAHTFRATLPDGLKVVLLSKKTRGNDVIGLLRLRFGDLKSLEGRVPASFFIGPMLMRGTQRHSRQQIQDQLDRLKAQVFVWSGAGMVGINIQTTRPNVDAVLKLVAEMLREPSFPDTEFEPARQARLAMIEGNRSNPTFQARNELQRLLNPYPTNDVRAVKTPAEEIAECKQVTLADVRNLYREFYGASYGELVLVGDFDAEQVRQHASGLFGDWKNPRPFARIPAPYTKVVPVNRTIDSPDQANAMFTAGTNINLIQSHPDFAAMALANFMIGGSTSSRLLERLRKKEGWSYGAFSSLWINPKENGGNFTATAILNPQNMPKLEQAFREEMEKVMKDGFTAEQVAQAKKTWLEQQIVGRSQDQSLTQLLAQNEFLGRTMDWDAKLEKNVQALTPEAVNTAIRRHLDLNALTIVKAGDFKKTIAAK